VTEAATKEQTPHTLFFTPLMLCKQAKADSRIRRPSNFILIAELIINL
jgi:hypothetical protein